MLKQVLYILAIGKTIMVGHVFKASQTRPTLPKKKSYKAKPGLNDSMFPKGYKKPDHSVVVHDQARSRVLKDRHSTDTNSQHCDQGKPLQGPNLKCKSFKREQAFEDTSTKLWGSILGAFHW